MAVGFVLALVLVLLRPQVPIPTEIRKQLNFSVFYPNKRSIYKVDQKTASYDPKTKVLIFHAKSANNDLTIAEQATPDPFNDIPQYYEKFTQVLNGYKDFDSANGKVSLTRPKELSGGQSAVFNNKGTLMFVHPAHDLSDDEWRKFFDALDNVAND